MALAEGDDRVTVGVVDDARRFEIREHRPDRIHRAVAGRDMARYQQLVAQRGRRMSGSVDRFRRAGGGRV